MSDEELIARLRLYGRSEVAVLEAADRIEALTEQLAVARQDVKAAEDELEMQEQEACMMEDDYIKLEKERDAIEAKLAKSLKALDKIAGKATFADDPWGIARATIAEIKGETK